MCLTLKSDANIKKTDKPIVVYKYLKYLNGMGFSLVERYYYQPNILQPKVKMYRKHNLVYDGYHSRKKLSDEFNNAVFVIPKGAEYYEGGENGSNVVNYVSNTIIYVGHAMNPLTWFKLIYYKWIR